MSTTSRAALYLCPPPAARVASSRPGDTRASARGSRVRTHLRPLLRATSRALLRLADFTSRHGLMFAGLVVATASIVA